MTNVIFELVEWFITAASETAEVSKPPWVRIPSSPQEALTLIKAISVRASPVLVVNVWLLTC